MDEHERFMTGLHAFGRGKWKDISGVVGTRTEHQVERHAYHVYAQSAKLGVSIEEVGPMPPRVPSNPPLLLAAAVVAARANRDPAAPVPDQRRRVNRRAAAFASAAAEAHQDASNALSLSLILESQVPSAAPLVQAQAPLQVHSVPCTQLGQPEHELDTQHTLPASAGETAAKERSENAPAGVPASPAAHTHEPRQGDPQADNTPKRRAQVDTQSQSQSPFASNTT
eukprot:TRINITY_DN5684_c0_g1_i1.p2 TRINITY_DN5684_c0_g1~~TRINITY_DN5684_c0_g1_i1.p2  ORF type:complete len:226 (-),score=33.63 TRINITY_DN5684_c0_g1_i1:19-696(-)